MGLAKRSVHCLIQPCIVFHAVLMRIEEINGEDTVQSGAGRPSDGHTILSTENYFRISPFLACTMSTELRFISLTPILIMLCNPGSWGSRHFACLRVSS